MTTPATKSIKVTPTAHKALKVGAAKRGMHVYELVDQLLYAIARIGEHEKKNSGKIRGGK